MGEPLAIVNCQECGQPMRWRGTGLSWDGDYEIAEHRFECSNACQVAAVLTYRQFIPVDLANAKRQE